MEARRQALVGEGPCLRHRSDSVTPVGACHNERQFPKKGGQRREDSRRFHCLRQASSLLSRYPSPRLPHFPYPYPPDPLTTSPSSPLPSSVHTMVKETCVDPRKPFLHHTDRRGPLSANITIYSRSSPTPPRPISKRPTAKSADPTRHSSKAYVLIHDVAGRFDCIQTRAVTQNFSRK